MPRDTTKQVIEVSGHAAGDMADQLQVGILSQAYPLLAHARDIADQQQGQSLGWLRAKAVGALPLAGFATAFQFVRPITMEQQVEIVTRERRKGCLQ